MTTVNTETSSLKKEMSNLNSDGLSVGQSAADLVGFHGATPVAQQTAPTAVTTIASTTATPSYAFTTQAQADGIVTAINAIISKLTTKGLWA